MQERRQLLEEYQQLAPNYDKRWSDYIDGSLALTLEQLPPAVEGRVLDIGCGTGSLLHEIRQRHTVAELFGIDISAPMLDLARDKLGSAITLINADCRQLPFPDNYFDVVVSSSVLHYLEQQQEEILEISRVVRPGGVIVITDWCKNYLSMRALDRWLVLSGKVNGKMLYEQELKGLLALAGLEQLHSVQRRISSLWGLMSCRGEKPAAT